jgi:hypothetical protein
MGYATTTIAFYGVELSYEEAKKIFEERFGDEEEFDYDTKDTTTDEVASVHHIRGTTYRERAMPQMLADGADSRINNMAFDEESERHVIGVYLASRGYAHTDKIEDYIKSPSEKAKANYEKYILPILKEEGIEREPSILIVTQTW